MHARVEAKSQWRVDCFAVRRTAKPPRLMPMRVARLPSRSVTWRPSRGLSLRYSSLRAPLKPISASTSNVVTPVSDSIDGVRDLGWSRDFAERFEMEDTVLGEGSFGMVKPVIKKDTGKRYAAKLLPKNVQTEWKRYSALIEREVTHWQQLEDCQQVVHLEGVYEVE